MSAPQEHSSFIKTPQQLVVVILLAFAVPVFGIAMIVHLVIGGPKPDATATAPEAVAARIAPVGRVEVAAPVAGGGAGARSGEQIVKTYCVACHETGAAGAPKIGDAAAWKPLARKGLERLLAVTIKGEKAMPPRGAATDATDLELARAIVWMANRSGANLAEPGEVKLAKKK